MRFAPMAFLVAVLEGALASGCQRGIESSDAQTASKDADAVLDAPGESSGDHPPACYPLFHACTTDGECCAPNRCLNITGTPACQVEGPAPTQFTSWRSCGWSSSGTCLCDGINGCVAVAGGAFSALGSQQARVCGIDGDVCEYVVFVETEGGGTARRCRVPIGAGSCTAGLGATADSDCVDLFTCNLLMGTCPPDVTPGGPVISCR
jgi:hypothetical protein